VEFEDLYTLCDDGTALIEVGTNRNLTGEVTGFAPPGDIHRVRNVNDRSAISLHVYGTDLNRIGSSLPVRPDT
jgi:3-mercaptopropionate dioxygenase